MRSTISGELGKQPGRRPADDRHTYEAATLPPMPPKAPPAPPPKAAAEEATTTPPPLRPPAAAPTAPPAAAPAVPPRTPANGRAKGTQCWPMVERRNHRSTYRPLHFPLLSRQRSQVRQH